MRRPGSRTGPWAPTSVTRLGEAERRSNGRRGGAVSPTDRKVDAVGLRGVVAFVRASPPLSLPDYPGNEDPRQPDTSPKRRRVNPGSDHRFTRRRFGLVWDLLPCRGHTGRWEDHRLTAPGPGRDRGSGDRSIQEVQKSVDFLFEVVGAW